MDMKRRDFLKLTGKGALGAAVMAVAPTVLGQAETDEVPEYPWTWQPLDKDEVMKHAYECFYSHGGCGSSVVAGILETLAAHYGYPYNQFPTKAFATLGGGFGAAELCGSLGGACTVLGIFAEASAARAMRDELYAWYRPHEFPQYQPEMESITTVANSIRCAESVGNYMQATGYAMGDPGRLARCAGLSAEVAAKVVELLNIHYGLEAAPAAEEAAADAPAANEYLGTAVSEIGGELKVKVTMDGDKIAAVEVLSHNETPGISDAAIAQIPEAIVKANTADVDIVTGATKTSQAIIAAVKDALTQVK